VVKTKGLEFRGEGDLKGGGMPGVTCRTAKRTVTEWSRGSPATQNISTRKGGKGKSGDGGVIG